MVLSDDVGTVDTDVVDVGVHKSTEEAHVVIRRSDAQVADGVALAVELTHEGMVGYADGRHEDARHVDVGTQSHHAALVGANAIVDLFGQRHEFCGGGDDLVAGVVRLKLRP